MTDARAWLPTLLDVFGLSVPVDVQGRSLLPLLADPSAATESIAVFSEMT